MVKREVYVLDYGAGNVRSIYNAIVQCAVGTDLEIDLKEIKEIGDFEKAEWLIFPGVGNFIKAMDFLVEQNYVEALTKYVQSNKHYLGICLGMQTLFQSSSEAHGLQGLGIIPGSVTRFPEEMEEPVPHIGWNGISSWKENSPLFSCLPTDCTTDDVKTYFVHSFCAMPTEENKDWILTTTDYGNQRFISSVQKGNVMATQFHPEKSGAVGLSVIRGFLQISATSESEYKIIEPSVDKKTHLAKRIIACLDVRTNDHGDLVVTKGDQYDVREAGNPSSTSGGTTGNVRNLGKPVDLCKRYYNEGADEVSFLNICSFREKTISDLPMLEVLKQASKEVFVPLTVGGGIREYTDDKGEVHSALDVASLYFRAGADKVSIGSDAVYAAERFYLPAESRKNNAKHVESSIESISKVYGKQAVVVSIDPRRVYLSDEEISSCKHTVIELDEKCGPNGEIFCWYQVTVKGGREGKDMDAIELAQACEKLGAGEILLNCVDMDGQKKGFDHKLVSAVKNAVTIPVIASSGAGQPEHFTNVFKETNCDAGLAAGIFHRHEVSIDDVKIELERNGIVTRRR